VRASTSTGAADSTEELSSLLHGLESSMTIQSVPCLPFFQCGGAT